MGTTGASAGQAMISAAESVLRAGGSIAFDDDPRGALYAAVDAVGPAAWHAWDRADARRALVLTGARARALGIVVGAVECIALNITEADDIEAIAGRRNRPPSVEGRAARKATSAACAAIALAKRAGLLPALLEGSGGLRDLAPTLRLPRMGMLRASEASETLDIDVEVSLPNAYTDDARLFAFRSAVSPVEHLALTIGAVERVAAPLCRLHSECLTGDVLGSLRCDCGEQLDAALIRMAAEGAGVLLYLRQEGRGIGLLNKLRAYELQEGGLDTLDANTHLGFHADERDFAVAATILRRLGIGRVRLLTNNPDKVEMLQRHGVAIVAREPLCVPANRHNRAYLQTKARRSGHLLRAVPDDRSRLPLGA
jgi:GTP cyclohydrolase II